MKKDWICTDPDNQQYGRYISERLYEFKENNRYKDINDEGDIIQITININNYSEKDIYEYLSTYYTIQQIDRMLTGGEDEDEWIIAECIFEQESGLY